MKNHLTHAAIAVAATSLVGFAALAGDELAFSPAVGLESTKTFTESTTLELKKASISIGGQELPSDALELSLTHARAVEVKDTYGDSVDGAPRSLERTFETVEATIESEAITPEGKDESSSVEAEHPLEGLAVEFSWDEKEEATVVEFAEGSKGDAELLEGLEIDMDLSLLLVPESGDKDDLGPGSKWIVDPDVLLALADPGGVGFVPLEVDDESQNLSFYFASLLSCRDLLASPEGEVEMLWKSTREVDGHRCAVFDLDVEVTGRRDLTESLLSKIAPVIPTAADDIATFEQVTAEFTLEGEGEVVWNLDENRLHSIELPLDMRVTLEAAGATEGQGLAVTLELEGQTELGVTIE